MKKVPVKTIGWIGITMAILSVLVFVGYYININEAPEPVITPAPTSEEVAEAFKQIIEQDEPQDESAINAANATATLDSVRENGTEFAIATRDFNSVTNKFEIELIATLGDPQLSNSYLAFITDGVSSLRLGTLVKETENTYSLTYETTEDITKLNEIDIIESGSETSDVLQGFFE